MNADSSVEERQTFLRENILDKGYDPNSFVKFLTDKRGEDAADVANWTMADLKIVVKEFINLQNKSTEKAQPNNQINYTKTSNNPLEDNPPINKNNSVKYDPLSAGNKPSIENQNNNNNTNKQNSSIKDFFVANNQNMNNNINNLNNPNMIYNNPNFINSNPNAINNNPNMQMSQQIQYLQYLQLLNQQNPQFQNQMLQLNMPNQQMPQMNPLSNNNIQNNQKNVNTQQNKEINNISNKNAPSQINKNNNTNNINDNNKSNQPEIKETNKEKEKEKIKENENEKIETKKEEEKPGENADIDVSLSYGIITNQFEMTKLLELTPLAKEENPIIQVGFPEKVDGGFFSKSYVTYLVTTNPLNLKVRRRYSDFEWLRQIMQNLYVWNVIPTTPRKNKLGSDKFGEPFLKKRMRTLEKFLNYLLLNPILKSSQLFYDFISIENDADFQKKKKTYEKTKPLTNIADFQTPFGRVNIQINKNKETYYENIKDNISINENLLIKLNENFNILKSQINNLTAKIDEIAQNWNDLCQNSIKYYDEEDIIKTYEQMNKLFSNWSEALKRHSNLVHIDIREYFKYTKNHFKAMKDLVYQVESNKNTYTKNMRNLINKKEDLFKKGDTNRWELDIQDKNNIQNLVQDKSLALMKIMPKDTNNVIGLKKTYGFYLNRIIEEYERIKKINCNLHKKNLIHDCEKMIEIYGDFQKGTADIINFFNNQNFQNKVIVNENNTKNNE